MTSGPIFDILLFLYFSAPHPPTMPAITPWCAPQMPLPNTPQAQSVGNLHPVLNNAPNVYPFLYWDIQHLPSSAQRYQAPGVPSVPPFEELAFHPGMRKMTVSFNHPIIARLMARWGPIEVYQPGMATDGIKFEHVMEAIYAYFHTPLHPREVQSLSFQDRERISQSFNRRVYGAQDLPLPTSARGPLRIDILDGCTRFAGLRSQSYIGSTCECILDLASTR